jgi:hypothetical protein
MLLNNLSGAEQTVLQPLQENVTLLATVVTAMDGSLDIDNFVKHVLVFSFIHLLRC